MALQTEDWNVILKRFDGLHTALNSDEIPDGRSPNLLNVRVAGSHVRGSTGYECAGTRREGTGSVHSKYTFKRNDGTQRLIRVRDNESTGVLEWWDATNEDWYTLLSGLTTGKLMGFAEFNTSSTNQCIFCNGVENVSVWTGAITRLTAALAGGETSIPVASTADFPSSGTIIYNGTEIAYSAKTATSFTVVSAHASSGADDGVAQAADDSTHSGVTKGNILLSAKDRLWIAGQPSAPNNLDYSDEGAAFTFTGGATRADSGTEDFFNIGGSITGLAEKGEEIIVLGPDGADGFSFTYPTSTTKAPKFREAFRAVGRGPLSFRSVIKAENEVYWASRNGVVALQDLEGTEKLIERSITRDILPTTKGYDFSDAVSIYHERESIMLVFCKSSSDSPANDMALGLEFYRDQAGNDIVGFVKFDWPGRSAAVLNDELYFGGSLELNSHKGFSTYQNDGAPRTIRYATKRFTFGNPYQAKGVRLAAVRGYIKDGTDIDVSVQFDSGFKGVLSKIIESTGEYVSQNALNTIGAFAVGTNPIGATLEEVSELKRFLVYLDLGVDYDWSDAQLIFESGTDGGTFIVDGVALCVEPQGYASQDKLTI